MEYRYFEDFVPGQKFKSHAMTVSEAEIIEFAKKFDPQPMHTDPAAAQAITGGLIASGWHTASLTMSLLITGGFYRPAPGTLGLGFDELRWKKPVRPGDSLYITLEVLSVREIASKPTHGIVNNQFVTFNQHDEPVQEMKSSAIIPKRNP